MTGHHRFAALLLPIIAIYGEAQAQDTIYTQPAFQLGRNGHGDGIVRETRNGDSLLNAEIDFCFQRDLNGKWDRIVLPLKVEGDTLTGTGLSQITRTPVGIELITKRGKSASSYTGRVQIAGEFSNVDQKDLWDRTREEITALQEPITLVEDPVDFTKVQPQILAVRFKLGQLKAVLAALRGEPLVLQTAYGLIEDCNALRSGRQTLQFTTSPETAAVLAAKLRKLPGVIAVGWSGANFMNYAARIPAAGWMTGGKIDQDKLVPELTKIIASSLSASVVSSRWDTNTGEFVVELKRPSQRFQDAGLSEAVTAKLLISRERVDANDHIVVWVMEVTANLLDDVPGARLEIPVFHEVGGEGFVDPEPSAAMIAKALGGVTWDSDLEKWAVAK
jgi:hypothetical protein